MQVSVAVFAAAGILWITFAYKTHQPYRSKVALLYGSLGAAALLEIFDFPPLFGLLDAHAIWHGLTPPLIYLYYDIAKEDHQLWQRSVKLL